MGRTVPRWIGRPRGPRGGRGWRGNRVTAWASPRAASYRWWGAAGGRLRSLAQRSTMTLSSSPMSEIGWRVGVGARKRMRTGMATKRRSDLTQVRTATEITGEGGEDAAAEIEGGARGWGWGRAAKRGWGWGRAAKRGDVAAEIVGERGRGQVGARLWTPSTLTPVVDGGEGEHHWGLGSIARREDTAEPCTTRGCGRLRYCFN
jgi:hypothetical protein